MKKIICILTSLVLAVGILQFPVMAEESENSGGTGLADQIKALVGAATQANDSVDGLADEGYLPEVNPEMDYAASVGLVTEYIRTNGIQTENGEYIMGYDTGVEDVEFCIYVLPDTETDPAFRVFMLYTPSGLSTDQIVTGYVNSLTLKGSSNIAETYINNYMEFAGQRIGSEGSGTLDTASFTRNTVLQLDEVKTPEDIGTEGATLEMLLCLQDGQNFLVEELQDFLTDIDAGISIGNLGFTSYTIDPNRGSGIRQGKMPAILPSDESGAAAAEEEEQKTEPAAETADQEEETETTAAEDSMLTAEELEAAISKQPVRVIDTEVTNNRDDRFELSTSTGILLPHVYNELGEPIAHLNVYFAAWDSNNQPVVLKSAYMGYTPSYTPNAIFQDVYLVNGGVLNTNEPDTYDVVTFDTVCGAAKAKAIVASYQTYDGTVWKNDLVQNWIDVYGNQVLEEIRVYTDAETVMAVQQALNEAGYDCGTPDGSAGPNTQNAIIRYKEDHGLAATADITDSLLTEMGLQ